MHVHEAIGPAQRLLWYVNRARCMSLAEIPYRLFRALAARAARSGLAGVQRAPAPDLAPRVPAWLQAAPGVDATRTCAAAERIIAGRFSLFALRDAALGSPPRWNRDPKSGVEAPLDFGPLLDYRDPARVGDIKYLWELNRHAHLVTLAQAWALSRDARYLRALGEQLESWFDACPYPRGPNWASALECALRLINWSAAWQLIGGADSPLFAGAPGLRQRWLQSVYQHAHFVHGNFSRFSSANNHLIGEAAGLFIAGLTWPYWADMRRWQQSAKAILEKEARRQNAADGVNREQAVSYQQFVLELLLLALLAGKANGQWFSVAYESRLEAMLEFLASIMDAGGNLPMFGDADDAVALRLSQEEHFSAGRSLLASGAILFHSGEFARKAGALDDKTRWLLGEGADAAFAAQAAAPAQLPPLRQAFREGGYYILGSEFESPEEIRLVVDAGPLGYERIAAHGHADALSFTLSVGGREFLIDPGTYAYHTQEAWRHYFRSTAAHNTLRLDGADQSQPGGKFMWLRQAAAGCSLWRSTPERDRFEGWHDGYARLSDPVLHRRAIRLEKRIRRVVIEDRLRTRGERLIELFFHCSERCAVEEDADGFALSRDGRTLRLRLPRAAGAEARVYRGSSAPILGWVSRRYDEKEPCATIAWRARLSGEVVLRSEIIC